MNAKILLVDGDSETRELYRGELGGLFKIETASNAPEALRCLRERGPYEVVVTAMDLPGSNGIDLLGQCQSIAPETVRMMLTSNNGRQTAIDAINQGHVFEFLSEPCSPDLFKQAIDRGIERHRSMVRERELLEKTLSGTIRIFTEVLSMLDLQSLPDLQKIREYTKILAEALALENRWELEAAAMLGHIGLLTVPSGIAQKIRLHTPLNVSEKALLERLPEITSKLLAHIPRFEAVGRIVRSQMKNFDGTGFPLDEAGGEKIPIGARLLKIATDLVELESEGVPKKVAVEQMRRRTGQYDPALLELAADRITSPQAAGASQGARPVKLAELQVGHRLVESVFTHDGVKIVGTGTTITPMLLEKLQNFTQLGSISEPLFVASSSSRGEPASS